MKPNIPALRGPGGGLVVASAEKASLLPSQFESKQCREQIVTPLFSIRQSRCNSLAFQTSVLLHLLLDFDTYGGVGVLGAFSLFLKKVVDIISPNPSIIFGRLMHLGSFPECWQSANVTEIPEGAPS